MFWEVVKETESLFRLSFLPVPFRLIHPELSVYGSFKNHTPSLHMLYLHLLIPRVELGKLDERDGLNSGR